MEFWTHLNASFNPLNEDRGGVLTRVTYKCSKLDSVKIFSGIYTSTNSSCEPEK